MMEQIYPIYDINNLMPDGYGPGRIRHYTLLKEAYGSSSKEVVSNLESIKSNNVCCRFNKSNYASQNLKLALDEVNKNYKLGNYLTPISGTFNFRVIAGTNRLSPHAFGIAIDLKSNKSDYWRWASKEQGEKRLQEYPEEIVKSFEKYGFVWGGKWNHFDILHFEYRPEIIFKAKFFADQNFDNKYWYEGFIGDEKAQSYIDIINKL